MADREEVLKGLEHHRHLEASRNELGHDECFDCPYRPYGEDTCASLDRMIDDALELLKEQDEIIDALLKVGYPHNFQREPPWIVNYMYSITDVVRKAVHLRNEEVKFGG